MVPARCSLDGAGRARVVGAIDGGPQIGEERFARRLMVAIRCVDQGTHVILGFQNCGDQFPGCRNLALADAVEGGLAVMGESGKGVEAEHCSRSLQRVEAAEDRVHLILVAEVYVQVEKPCFDLLQKLGR